MALARIRIMRQRAKKTWLTVPTGIVPSTEGRNRNRYGCSLLVDLRGEGAPPTWLERESLLQYTNERCEYEETPHHC
ncbi:unnamed protein product [Allacma fusca]|uniref:Uncharacterized protein n=1 Tax=Allacma fusca TaxID=39272 RepID=A0A8J2LNB5_9HEXA|nr:unnamed protein product [Allacma fusca]